MRPLAEILAGCPRPSVSPEKKSSWPSSQAFPGFMLNRMYVLISRPKEAIGEFGADDYRTPFLFFFFFTIVIALLQNLALLLSMATLSFTTMGDLVGQSFMEEAASALGIIGSNSLSFLVFGTIDSVIHTCMYLGVSIVLLALGLWIATGVRCWNPAFAIAAYCSPVPALLGLIPAFIAIPWVFRISVALSWVANAAWIAGIVLTIVIAGYGITALTRVPIKKSVILAISWTVVAIIAIIVVRHYGVVPLERGLRSIIAERLFPEHFSTAGAVAKIP
jgi:hypothetical protein